MRRRPPFALVLVALVALFAGAIALLAGGGNGSSPGRGRPEVPSLPGSGPVRACVTTRAVATATARSAVRAEASASVPLSVVERATLGGASVAARLSENVVERAVIARPVLVRRGAVVARRACARGVSVVAARGTALTRAYKTALAAAHSRARALAASTLQAYIASLTPSTFAAAHAAALARAHAAAIAARPALEREALSQARARARAGGG